MSVFSNRLKSFASLRLLGVVGLLGSATIAHAHPDDATSLADQPALLGFDSVVVPSIEHSASNPNKKPLPKVKKKPKKKKSLPGTIKVKDEAASEGQSVPNPTALQAYIASKTLLAAKDDPAKAAIASVKKDEFNNREDAIEGVPIPADLPALRRAVIDTARAELGKVEGVPNPVIEWKNPVTGKVISIKKGVDRLVEYNALAFGTNIGMWLNTDKLPQLVTAGQKHDTWCGIFGLWAVKRAAGVGLIDLADLAQQQYTAYPTLLPFVALFSTVLGLPGKNSAHQQLYKKLQWDSVGGSIYLYDTDATNLVSMDAQIPTNGTTASVKHRLASTGIYNWLTKKKTVPPIKPGDLGVTREKAKGGLTHHVYVIERILEVGGKYIYFTIEGNYHGQGTGGNNQMIVRNYRVYVPGYTPGASTTPDRHVIEGWFDIEEMPRDASNNRHTKKVDDQP